MKGVESLRIESFKGFWKSRQFQGLDFWESQDRDFEKIPESRRGLIMTDFGDGIQRRGASSFDIHWVGCEIWDPGCPLGKSAEMKFPSSRVHKLLEWVPPSSAKLSWFDFLLMQFDVKAKIIFATLIWSGNKSLDLLCSDVVGLGFPSPLSSLILKNIIDNDYPGSGICKRLIFAKKIFVPQYIQKQCRPCLCETGE